MTGRPLSGGPLAGGTVARGRPREYALVLATAAAGALLVLVSVRQGWARVVTAAPAPLPSATVPVSGQDLVPVAGALALASLAGLAAVIATRGLARRLVGVFLAVSGALTVLLVSAHVSTAGVLAAARATPVSQAGSATAGGGTGTGAGAVSGASPPGVGAVHVVLVAFPWRPLAVVGGLAVLTAGIVVAWRGPRWPALSSRYSRTGGGDPPPPVADTAALWESLSRGVDPTEQPDQAGRPLGS
ncbi:MAG TPA: Trp biosynthesis-associated membrane protein [Streptosporangiaceae bacterium]|nr:Trp biosynthesis-associated membrane protein [Streptosporangiaceae bacterium]